MREIVCRHRSRIADHTVVRIVKEKLVGPALGAMPANARHQFVVVPLMNDDYIGASKSFIQVQSLRVVQDTAQAGMRAMEIVNRGLPMLPQQILAAPAILRLEDFQFVAAVK
jgi:hypothetical protein